MGEEEVAAAAVAALFASRPRSFRMDRRSAEAARLKAAVSRKLLDFLGNYTDDVLAEYIVVLVCNGKHQNQARDDLEAFLGDDSEKFVAWLWHHLSEEASLLKVPIGCLNQKADAVAADSDDVGEDQKNGTLTDFQTEPARSYDISLANYGKHGSSNNSVLNSSCGLKVLEEVSRRSMELANNELRELVCRIDRPCEPNHGKNGDSLPYKSTKVHSFEASVGNQQSPRLVDSNEKIGSSKFNGTACVSPKQEPNTRNLRSVLAGDSHLRHQLSTKVASGRLSPEAIDSVSHQSKHRRGTVWDRLGKPREDTNVWMNERLHQHGLHVINRRKLDHSGEGFDKNERLHQHGFHAIKRRKLDHSGEGFDKHRLAPPLSDRLSKRVFGATTSVENSHVSPPSSNVAVEHGEMDCSIYTLDTGKGIVYSGKRRNFGDKDPGNGLSALSDHRDSNLEDKKTHQMLHGFSASTIPKQSLKQVTAESSLPSEAAGQSLKSVKVLHNFRPKEVSQLQASVELSMPISAQDPAPVDRTIESKLDSVSDPEHAAASHKPVEDEVLDMKQRLRQIEREMLELRSKQTSMNTDSKAVASQVSSLRNFPEEDSDVRTVFVTNVHFAAPKEALSSHFAQCGPVVRVVLLTDSISGQPKGSAYIVFANKESADKAMSLSGTSFFSRALKVVRKADVPAGTLAPNHTAGRPPRPWFSPQSHGKSPFQRQFSGHLQWKRDQASGGTGDDSASAPFSHKLEASGATE